MNKQYLIDEKNKLEERFNVTVKARDEAINEITLLQGEFRALEKLITGWIDAKPKKEKK